MDNHFPTFLGPYEDASVPSIADLEKLPLPDFTFGDIHPLMDFPKIKAEPISTFEESPSLANHRRHFNFAYSPTPSTPLYSPAVTSNQSSPASFTDEDYSDEDRSYGRNNSFQLSTVPANLLNISDDQLAQYSARDINRSCKGCPDEVVKQIKKRRRTLKNRGYASNSRVRRLQQKTELESTKNQLQREVEQLRLEIVDMRKQRDYYKNRAEFLAKRAAQK